MSISADHQHLHHALALASEYRGQCAPNPAVGAVVVKDNRVLSTGVHRGAGTAHAERDALLKLDKQQTAGSTLYVSLEPCCHQGRTPPCTILIINYGIKRVVYGIDDPNPLVAGKGVSALRAKGVECNRIELDAIEKFYRAYCFWQQHQRPWISAKLALSLDGKIAGVGGRRISISGKEAQQITHQLRSDADAIVTTARTVLQDDPLFTVRLPEQPAMAKPVYVLDSRTALAEKNTLAMITEKRHITLFYDKAHTPPEQAQTVFTYAPVPMQANRLDWQAILAQIAADGMHHVWVEAGGTCFQSLLAAGLLNEAYIYISPCVLGANAYDAFLEPMTFAADATAVSWQQAGQDSICHIRFCT